MKAKARMTVLLAIVCFSLAGWAQTGRRVWVLRESGEMTEYDPSTWNIKGTIRIPAEAFHNPDALSINKTGRIVFCHVAEGSAAKVWLWNGRDGVYLDPTTTRPYFSPDSGTRCTLSADGGSLYWFGNVFRVLRKTEGVDLSVSTTFRAWHSSLAGEQRVEITGLAFRPCKCGTGVCSDTCPEGAVWLPDEGVENFFLVTRWIPGQIGSTYQSSSVIRKTGATWTEHKLPKPLENIEDAAHAGTIIVYSIPDGGCCGWENEGNDQTILAADGKETVIFDEVRKFANSNYDVSFFTSNAKLSPDLRSVAMTIVSTASPGSGIRLSESGKADPEALARIRRSVGELPVVEVLRADDPSKRAALLPHASLVGWLDNDQILIVENGTLVVLDVVKGTRRPSPVRATDAVVFLR